MNIKLVGMLAACGSLMGLACGDSTSDAGGGGSGTGAGNTGGDTSTGAGDTGGDPSGGGGGGTTELTCEEACDIVFNCGLEGEPPLCVYTAADEEGFVPECIVGCGEMPALLSIVDGDDCPGTIGTIKAVNADFAGFCDEGGGEGGAGGAP